MCLSGVEYDGLPVRSCYSCPACPVSHTPNLFPLIFLTYKLFPRYLAGALNLCTWLLSEIYMKKLKLIYALLPLLAFTSCKKDSPVKPVTPTKPVIAAVSDSVAYTIEGVT